MPSEAEENSRQCRTSGAKEQESTFIASQATPVTPSLSTRPFTPSSPSTNERAGLSQSHSLIDSRNLVITDGQFNQTHGHHTSLVIHINQGSPADSQSGSPPLNETGHTHFSGPSTQFHHERDQPRVFSHSQEIPHQKSNDIYQRHLTPKGRGFPLWIPEPNQVLHIGYRRTGVRIGDVGIITHSGGFSFLFNICLPHNDPVNPRILPEHFAPISPPIEATDIEKFLVFKNGSHLASASVKRSQTGAAISDIVFESSASEGAILTMPRGARSEDLGNLATFREYAAANVADWYQFVNGPRGREAKNGDVRLVVGFDKTTSWGIATFANQTQQNSCHLKFGPSEGDSTKTYAWEYSGVAEVRVGPDSDENDELRMDNDSPDVQFQNQCLFVRTLNVTLADDVWADIHSSSGSVHVDPRNNQYPRVKDYSDSNRAHSNNPGTNTGSNVSPSQGAQSGIQRRLQGVDNPKIFVSGPVESIMAHPSKVLNDALLAKIPTAKMVITHDDDWSSVTQYDTLLDPREVVTNILASRDIHQENGVIFLQPKIITNQMSEVITVNHAEVSEAAPVQGSPPKYIDVALSADDQPSLLHDELGFEKIIQESLLSDRSLRGEEYVSLPLHNSPKKQKMVPPKETEALQSTRKRVAQAIVSVLGTNADITHKALYIGMDFPELAPISGLKPAAKLLLNIWDASQLVCMNRLGCLRLMERCAEILISVREEISDVGDVLGQELAAPIQKLEESFVAVHSFLIKQISRPFLKQYLRRDETLQDMSACDSTLRDTIGLFGISIQIRILRQVQETERRRQVETKALLDAIMNGHLPLPTPDSKSTIEDMKTPTSINYQSRTVAHFTTTENTLDLEVPQDLLPSQIMPVLASLHSLQNSLDLAMDTADLRQLMRAALQTTTDSQILEVLQIDHQEIPDAIKMLQRALERVTVRHGDGAEAPPEKSVMAKVVKKASLREAEGPGSPGGSLKLSRTMISIDSTTSSGRGSEIREDTLDREFIESWIDALRRMSRGIETSLPSWTITKYEIDRDKKIGIGFFSDIYKGTWKGQTVAIKVLAESTPRNLFMREIGIWKTLCHRNILPLYGASSASGHPPFFFVSSYMKNGSLVEHLKRVELQGPGNLGIGMGSTQMPLSQIRSSTLGPRISRPPWAAVCGTSPTRRDLTPPDSRGRTPTQEDTVIHREWDLFRFMHEIVKGMEYLHSQGALHGDLKGANVLVDDKYRCVISDFGQSEMKSEAYRISGTPLPHGTLRWQSPELMAGQSQSTQEIDVWAFSICCVEILTMGRIPWPFHNDDSVRQFILKDDSRPPLPDNSRFNTEGLQDILRICWSTKPTQRPTFSKLVEYFKQLRKSSGQEIVDSPRIPAIDEVPEMTCSPSLDTRPASLPEYLQAADNDLPDNVLPELDNIFQTSGQRSGLSDVLHSESAVSTKDMKTPEPVIYTHVSPRRSSLIIPPSQSEEQINVSDYDGYDTPPPNDERITDIRNERRYRLLLTHDYHPSLTLPLWDPSPVEVGAVGYLSKPRGHFVTLFNALTPNLAENFGIQSLPSIYGSGPAQLDIYREDRRTVTQKSMDILAGLLTFGAASEKVSRRYSYPLKAGHKVAYLCTETTDYEYLKSLEAPKKWFQTHVDFIMQTYGVQHNIQKEDLFLVIGTLRTPNYALFVSHSHLEGHANFSVYATPKHKNPWGIFTTDPEIPRDLGLSYDGPSKITSAQDSKSKVSTIHAGPWDTVLLARLRFKPDVLEPTSK